jgi:hypothetical protein
VLAGKTFAPRPSSGCGAGADALASQVRDQAGKGLPIILTVRSYASRISVISLSDLDMGLSSWVRGYNTASEPAGEVC